MKQFSFLHVHASRIYELVRPSHRDLCAVKGKKGVVMSVAILAQVQTHTEEHPSEAAAWQVQAVSRLGIVGSGLAAVKVACVPLLLWFKFLAPTCAVSPRVLAPPV